MLLESPYGARTEPRIREHFDRLVDRISTYEVRALATGDGFTEKKYEPASIDELLAVSTTFGTPAAASDLKATVQSDLLSADHDIPIPLNQRVLAYIELFQGRLHDFIEEGMKRGSKYLPMIQNVFRAEGLPLDLAYVPLVESAFKPNALSRAKAKGVWQFMAGTALENGLRRDWYIDERSDPEKATGRGGEIPADARQALRRRLAPGARVLQRRAGPPAARREIEPPGRLLEAGGEAEAPAARNPRVRADDPRGHRHRPEPGAVRLRFLPRRRWPTTASRCPAPSTCAASPSGPTRRSTRFRRSTPELRRWTTPVKDTQYELKVPAGTADQVRDRLADAPVAELASLKYYTVKRGDTLPLIAKKLHVSKADLAEANSLKATARVEAGDQLVVPHEATVLMAARSDRAVPGDTSADHGGAVGSARAGRSEFKPRESVVIR